MTLDLAKLRAETLALMEGTTPGPWWTDGKYDGRDMGCAIIAARTDAGPLPGNPTRGMVAFSSAITNTQARGCEANARLIAAAPTLAADTLRLVDDNLRLLDEIEQLKRALVEAAIPLEAMILATQDDTAGRRLYGEPLWNGIVAGVEAVRTALAEGGPDDR